MTLINQIQQAPGRCHEDIDAVAHGIDLRHRSDAAIDQGLAKFDQLSISRKALADLPRKLTRRRQHQGTTCLRSHGFAAIMKLLQNRQCETRGLAGAGLRTTEQILALQQNRNRLCLNRRWFFVAKLFQHLLQGRRQRQRVKSIGLHFLISSAPTRSRRRTCR